MSGDDPLEDSMADVDGGDEQQQEQDQENAGDVSVSQAEAGGEEDDGADAEDAAEESKLDADEAAPEDGAAQAATNPTAHAEAAGELKEDASPAAQSTSAAAPAAAAPAPKAARTSSVSGAVPVAAGGADTADAASAASAQEVQRRIALQSKRREEELARQKLEEEKEFPPGFHYSADSDELARFLKPFELSQEYINLHASFGYACQKRCNIHYIDFGVLLYATGNTVQLVDLFQEQHVHHRFKTVLLGHGRDSNTGIGALAVHPSRQFFAVAEKGTNPSIFVYNYPNKEVVRILARGTERAYADLQFSHTGSKLVSVGAEPDFLLTVWDWARERVILRTKAFSQEVFRVAFSPVNEGRILTSGTGHIRFWKMAKTFTGLKLQGAIGKFGQVELSDISAFVELPDGKVLSGTEAGNLLMWDGNFIQYTVMRAVPGVGPDGAATMERRPCHDGMVEHISLDESSGVREIVTAGLDGFVRKWRFDRLEFAEASEEDPVIALEPLAEVKIGPGVQIKSMIRGDDHWIIQDSNGGLFKLFHTDYRVQRLLDCHAGKINAMEPAPLAAHIAVTAGQDHSIRCWDVLQGEQLYSRSFNAAATSLLWAPASVDPEQRILLAGFGDGVVRVLKRYKDSFKLHHTFKPHTRAVTQMAMAPDGMMLATASEDGQLFFLAIGAKSKCANLVPLGFVKLAHRPLSLNWSADSARLLLCAGPDVLEFTRPVASEYTDPVRMAARDTYEIALPHRVFRPIIRDYRPADVQEEDDIAEATAARLLAEGAQLGGAELDEFGNLRVREPSKPKPVLGVDVVYDISAVLYSPLNPDTFFVTLDGGGNREDPHYFPGQKIETLYECQFSPENTSVAPVQQPTSMLAKPVEAAPVPTGPGLNGEPLRSVYLGRHIGTIHTMRVSHSGKYLLLGTRNGGAQLRALTDLSYFFYTHFHDGTGGAVIAHSSQATNDHATGAGGATGKNAGNTQWPITDRQGVVSAVCTTFDDRFLLSVGHDGNFFAHAIDPEAALAHMDRSIEMAVAAERKAAEDARAAYIRAKEEFIEQQRKEQEERLAKEAAAAQRKDARTREQKDREARELKEKELRDREAKERRERERDARLKLRDDRKNDHERDDDNFDHLSTRIPDRSTTKLPLPDASLAQEALEPRNKASTSALDEDALDITDPRSYSIEEAKLKQEEDDRQAAAEKKKQAMRLEVAELRKEFVQLLRQNAALDKTQRLPRDAFELDPTLRAELEQEAQQKIDEVRAELAWISEKHSLALQKLRAKFLDNLLVEHISLRAFNDNIAVACFRTPELPPFLRQAIEHVHRMMESEENLRTQQEQQMSLSTQHAQANASGAAGIDTDDAGAARGSGLRGALKARANAKFGGTASASGSRHRPAGMSEADMRKQARAERAVQLARLKAAKPDKNTDDPADVAAVQWAERNMGDYKLKSDPNYIVPESQRVNAERKRRQMVLLQESVHYIKMALNERFLALRDLKARIIKNIQKDNARVRELNALLGIEEDLADPELDPAEWPEHRELFTKEDLLKFETERERERVRQVNVGTRSIFSSAHEHFDEEEEKKQAGLEGAAAAAAKVAAAKAAAARSALDYSLVNPPPGLSSMESTDISIQRKLAAHERVSLLERMSFALHSFDGAVRKLRREKFKLDADLKSTDLKLLTLYQELHLLKAFEEKENTLFSKLSKARAAKAAVVSEMADCEKQLSHKLSEIKAWQEKDKQVLSDFNLVVGGEKSEFYSALLKIFKKKVKRNKKGGAGGGAGGGAARGDDLDNDDGDDSDADGGNSSSDGSGSDDSDSDDSDDDSCPLHLDSAIYEKVLELREKRLEQEEILSDFNRSVSELNKAYERLGGRERLIDKELSSTESDIEAFQSEKQRALNQIDVCLPLKLHQLKFLTPQGGLPKDISSALIFTSSGLTRLQRRILELSSEKSALQRQFKDLKKQHRVLLRELAARREEIAVEKAKCEDVQMLKFGQIIDLHILEKVGVDEGAAELRAKLSALETGGVQRAEEWDQKIEAARNELARITEQNTRWLDKVSKLTKAQYDLEDTLNHTRNVHVADSSPLDDQSDLERRQLLELVQLQERELDGLKAEIHMLRRKGGHLYTPQA